jgi:hypothetical protein
LRYAALILILSLYALSSPAGAVTLQVDVVNMTKKEAMSDYPLSVKVGRPKADGTMETLRTIPIRTDAQGAFAGELAAEPGSAMLIEVNYRGIPYASGVLTVETGRESFSLSLPVYELTDDRGQVAIAGREIVLVPQNERFVQVFETLTVENTGNRTYIGKFSDELDVNQVLFVPMPRGYALRSLDGVPSSEVLTLTGGLATRHEVTPGTRRILLTYSVRSDTGFFDLSLFEANDAPETRYLSVLFADAPDWNIQTGDLREAGSREFGGQRYAEWKGMFGSVNHIRVYGPTYTPTTRIWAVTLALVFLLALIGLVLLRQPLRNWYLSREHRRLERLIEEMEDGLSESGLKEYYGPFLATIEERLREIDARLGT